MNKKLSVAALLIMSAVLSLSLDTSTETNCDISKVPTELNLPGNEFIIGALDNAYDLDNSMTVDLGLNLWHQYTAPMNKGWLLPTGGYDGSDNITSIGVPSNVGDRLDDNEQSGIYSLMDRPKFHYLAYGQRSDYQCEEMDEDEKYWFYSYKTHDVGDTMTDNSQHGHGEKVRHCTTNDGTGWIVKDLISNREQANYFFKSCFPNPSLGSYYNLHE